MSVRVVMGMMMQGSKVSQGMGVTDLPIDILRRSLDVARLAVDAAGRNRQLPLLSKDVARG